MRRGAHVFFLFFFLLFEILGGNLEEGILGIFRGKRERIFVEYFWVLWEDVSRSTLAEKKFG